MDRDEAFRLLRGGEEGIREWNRRRDAGEGIPNLYGADLRGANLANANLMFASFYIDDPAGGGFVAACLDDANLTGADLREACLRKSTLQKAILTRAKLSFANLVSSDLRGADLSCARLIATNLAGADLSGADLRSAILQGAILAETNLAGANLNDCSIYGVSVWDTNLTGAKQSNLVVAVGAEEPTITVDNLEVAQFIYLLLHNERIREVINTITSKVVLILGRFTPDRKAVLDTIREELRKHDYCPVLFDFDKPSSRDFTETVSTLAHMARFIIADITDAKSIPQELQAIVPTLAVPVQPLLEGSSPGYGMFPDFSKYHWVLETHRYNDVNDLLRSLLANVITPAEAKAKELEAR